jgi:Mn2+/Fe2+ NRAMP family transporter
LHLQPAFQSVSFTVFSILLLFNGIDACIGHTCNTARLSRFCNNMSLNV